MRLNDNWIDVTYIGSLYEEQVNFFTGVTRRRPMIVDATYPLGVRRPYGGPWEIIATQTNDLQTPPEDQHGAEK